MLRWVATGFAVAAGVLVTLLVVLLVPMALLVLIAALGVAFLWWGVQRFRRHRGGFGAGLAVTAGVSLMLLTPITAVLLYSPISQSHSPAVGQTIQQIPGS